MRAVLLTLFGLLLLQCGRAQAGVIELKNDLNNPVYWSAFELDIMRLTWADTLGTKGGQTSQQSINEFIASTQDGWRWATAEEFSRIHLMFDTDPFQDGWSALQNEGSSLFFQLNGTGPAFDTQSGYDFEGYTYWQFGTEVEKQMQYVWMADFATDMLDIQCAEYSMLCHSGYFTDENTPLWRAEDILQMATINVAPLLVRDNSVPSSSSVNVAAIPLPASFALMILGIVSLAFRQHLRNK